MEHTVRQTFDASPERFWNMWLFDEEFFGERYRNMRCKVIERELVEDGHTVTRRVAFTPDRDLPSILKRLLQGVTLVREASVYDRATHECTVHVTLPVIGRATTFTGTYSCESATGDRFERVWRGSVSVAIPLVGRRLEQYFIGELERTLGDDQRFCARWLREHG